MKPLTRLGAIVAALALLLNSAPSWGGPPNPTASDVNGNTAGGTDAVLSVTTGVRNTGFGYGALRSVTAGDNNTATGFQALQLNTTGDNNTATGFQALLLNTTGLNNTAIGAKALKKSLGTKNIGIGYQAGVTLQTGNNNIYIGNQGAGNKSQTIRIGTAQTQTFIAGVAVAKVDNAEVVGVDVTTGQLGIVSLSSARYKQDIAPMGTRSEGVHQLRPVTFSYKDDAEATMRYGLVAEEVAAVYPQLVTYAPTGEIRAVKYQELIPMLLNELQRQRQTLERQEQTLQRQQQDSAEVATLRKELAELRALVGQRREMAASSR